jgi:hypothetical protein
VCGIEVSTSVPLEEADKTPDQMNSSESHPHSANVFPKTESSRIQKIKLCDGTEANRSTYDVEMVNNIVDFFTNDIIHFKRVALLALEATRSSHEVTKSSTLKCSTPAIPQIMSGSSRQVCPPFHWPIISS